MGFLIVLLTFLMMLDCVVLVFLVLIQLPKKEAGAGLAFGGSASDALFGAGSGTVLTKITKYVAGFFFGLAILLTVMQHAYARSSSRFEQRLSQPLAAPSAMPPVAPATAHPQTATTPSPAATQPGAAAGTNRLMSTPAPAAESPVVPILPAPTNAPAAAPPK
jgi:preprotein translocase subunit SecG